MEKKWFDYVRQQAEEFGVPVRLALLVFQALGPNEAYDGFISELEDLAEELDELEE